MPATLYSLTDNHRPPAQGCNNCGGLGGFIPHKTWDPSTTKILKIHPPQKFSARVVYYSILIWGLARPLPHCFPYKRSVAPHFFGFSPHLKLIVLVIQLTSLLLVYSLSTFPRYHCQVRYELLHGGSEHGSGYQHDRTCITVWCGLLLRVHVL